jgi:hypothetical protein
MRFETKDGCSLASFISPEALKKGTPVMDDMRGDMDFGVFPGNELAIHPNFPVFIKRAHL